MAVPFFVKSIAEWELSWPRMVVGGDSPWAISNPGVLKSASGPTHFNTLFAVEHILQRKTLQLCSGEA